MLTPKEGSTGSSLVEILVALAVFAMTITATTLIFFGGQNFVGSSLESRQAIQKAHDGFEALRFIRDGHWNTMTDGVHGLTFLASGSWALIAAPDTSDGFTRTVSISTDMYAVKHIDLTVSWSHPPEGTKSITLKQTLAAPNQGLLGDWKNPCVIGSADGTAGAKGTDVFYADGKAYVSSSTSTATKEDLFIFDVTTPTNPTLLGSLNVEQGWKSLTYSGNYVYGIEEDSSDFFVIDVSNPSAPVKRAKLVLTGGGDGRYVMVRGNYVYATTETSSLGPEFFVIDVTNPLTPTIAASREFGFDINEVSVLQNTAYLATSSDTKELVIVDVSNPLSPIEVGSYNATGTANGRSVHAKSSKRIYLGRDSSSDKEFLVLDASTPASVTLRGSKDASGNIYSLITAGNLSFLGTDDTNTEFQNLNIRDLSNITLNGTLNFSNIGTGADYDNNIVYMSVRNVDILQLVTSCDPS